MQAFLNFCRLEKGLSANSMGAYALDLAKWSAFRGESCELPGVEELRHYLDHLYRTGLSQRSIARHLTTLRGFYGFLLREGHVAADPTEHLGAPETVADHP
jgi:integrase/recombinase XerD